MNEYCGSCNSNIYEARKGILHIMYIMYSNMSETERGRGDRVSEFFLGRVQNFSASFRFFSLLNEIKSKRIYL